MKVKTHKRIFALGDEKVEILKSLIKRGDTMPAIAHLIRDEWGEMLDCKYDTVVQNLKRFKTFIAKEKTVEVLEANGSIDKVTKLIKKLDVIEELTTLAVIQKTRVEKVMVREGNLPLLLTQGGEEITRLCKTLETLGKLQLETGIMQRASKNITGEFVKDEEDPNVIKFRMSEDTMNAIDFLEGSDYDVIESIPE